MSSPSVLRGARTLCQQVSSQIPLRFSSTQAGPSKRKPKKPRVPQNSGSKFRDCIIDGQPVHVLRKLVNLHHTSAAFLHDPKDIDTGFENAFRHTATEPHFQTYRNFRDAALAGAAQKGLGGVGNLVERPTPESTGGILKARQQLKPAQTYWKTFQKHEDLWSQRSGSHRDRGMVSERELAVKEALFGTWERGGIGMRRTEPNYDGVQEYLAAKGTTIGESAREWEQRDLMEDDTTKQ